MACATEEEATWMRGTASLWAARFDELRKKKVVEELKRRKRSMDTKKRKWSLPQ